MSTSVSIIVEWYNATRAGAQRSNKALWELLSQARAFGRDDSSTAGRCELIITFNAARLSRGQVLQDIGAGVDNAGVDIRLVPVPDGTYCVQKNRGAVASHGEILVFIDSDVIPQTGWLPAIVEPMRNAAVDLVVGNTFVDYTDDGVYSKAFALTWMFPRRSEDTELAPAGDFYANNFAIRRDVFLEHPFRDIPGFIHAAAPGFVRELRDHGIPLWAAPRAQASHPPPKGLRHYAMRALATGRARALNPDGPGTVLRRLLNDCRTIAYHCKVIIHDREEVALPLLQAPAAMAISVSYDLLVTAGFLLAKAFPKRMRNILDL